MEHRHMASGGNHGHHMRHHNTGSGDPPMHSHHHHHHHHHPVETTTITTTATTFGEYVASHTPHSDIHGNHADMNNAKEIDHVHHHHHHRHHEGHHHGNALGPMGMGGQTGGHGMHHGMGDMKQVFRWVTDGPVLFQQWTTSTALELAMAMLVAAFLAAAYEWLRNWLPVWDDTRRSLSDMPRWKRLCLHTVRSLLHVLTAAVSYLQMLFAMTYDLRIFVAIILGSGMGFFVLGPYFRRLRIEQTSRRAFSERRGGYMDGSGAENGKAQWMLKDGEERAEKSAAADGENGDCELLRRSSLDWETVL